MSEEQLKVDISTIQQDVKYIQTDLKELKEDFKAFCTGADKKFASKLAEVIIYGFVGIIIIAVATALVASVVTAATFIAQDYPNIITYA